MFVGLEAYVSDVKFTYKDSLKWVGRIFKSNHSPQVDIFEYKVVYKVEVMYALNSYQKVMHFKVV